MSRAEDLLGMILRDRFRVDSVVSEATDFFVFAGREVSPPTDQPVTIRIVRALRGSSEEELRDAFDQFAIEAEQLAQVSKASPNVEQLLASGEAQAPDRERLAFCVFARTDGTSLAELIKNRGGAQPLGRVIHALQPVVDALTIAHDQGAHHGDVRPDNLILRREEAAKGDPTIKIVRFTLATRLGSPTRTFSPSYGAPEHFKRSYGDSSIGPPTDVYGLALCVVQLVTGNPPFEGTHQSELYKQTTDITRRPTLLARGAKDITPAVDGVMAKALAVNPKLRFPNAALFWNALIAAAGPAVMAESGPSLAASDSSPAAATIEAPPPTPTPSPIIEAAAAAAAVAPPPPSSSVPDLPPPPPPPAPPRLSRTTLAGIWGAGLAVLVVGIVLIAIVVFSSSKKQTTTSTIAAVQSSTASAIAMVEPTSSSSAAPAPPSSSAPPSVAIGARAEGMIRIEASTFTMGKDTEGKGDRPAHKVKLTKAFYLDRTEVTSEAYSGCIEAGACERRTLHVGKKIQGAWGCNFEKVYANHPANCVDRQQAAAYCAWVKKRLPTEAEWELAARGTDERDFPWGSSTPTTCAQGVISGVSGACGERKGTFPVGSAPEGKSPFGVQDMAGNVWEWVADDYAPYPDNEVTDPMITVPPSENPTKGILRGGSWDYGAQAAKTTYRLPFVAEAGNGSIGVRCARNTD